MNRKEALCILASGGTLLMEKDGIESLVKFDDEGYCIYRPLYGNKWISTESGHNIIMDSLGNSEICFEEYCEEEEEEEMEEGIITGLDVLKALIVEGKTLKVELDPAPVFDKMAGRLYKFEDGVLISRLGRTDWLCSNLSLNNLLAHEFTVVE